MSFSLLIVSIISYYPGHCKDLSESNRAHCLDSNSNAPTDSIALLVAIAASIDFCSSA